MNNEMPQFAVGRFRNQMNGYWVISLVVVIFYLCIAVLLGQRHDYSAYSDQWALILSGANPWVNHGVWTGNAYGLFFNFFSIFYFIHPLFPKVLFILSWMASGFWFLSQTQWRRSERAQLILLFFLNPLFLIEFLSYGLNDSVVASLLLFAVVFSEKRRVYSGIFLGLGVLLKFMPIVLSPLFWISPRQSIRSWNHSFIVSFLGVVLGGLMLSYGLWGDSLWFPLNFASHRLLKDLSIFRYLSSELSLGRRGLSEAWIADWSRALIFSSSLAVFWVYFRNRMSLVQAVATELLVTLMFYQVGHLQFQSTLLFLFPLLVIDFRRRGVWSHSKKRVMICYVSFLAGFQLFVTLMGQYHPLVEWVRLWISIPYFLLALALLGCLRPDGTSLLIDQ